jgi:hypothetical protein
MPLVAERNQQVIDVISDCQAKCVACAHDCASQGNSDLARCIRLCLDCAVLCQACVPLLASDSALSPALCGLCADACQQCADECDRVGMTECAEVCRRGAELCREMAGANG